MISADTSPRRFLVFKEASMSTTSQPPVDEAKLNAFVGRMLGDLGALTNSILVNVGDRLGLYKALVKSGPTDSVALAKQTGGDVEEARHKDRAFIVGEHHGLLGRQREFLRGAIIGDVTLSSLRR